MEGYLNGDLDAQDLELFNSKLSNEPEFENEFRELKAIKEGAKASARLSTLMQLEEIEASIQEKETTKIEFNMKKLVSVAASLILIATVSYFTMFDTSDVATGQEIFSEYYQPYQNRVTGVQRGGEALNISTLKQSAYDAYDAGKYGEAVSLFSSLLESEKSAPNYLYSGIANLENGNLEEAKNSLSTVMNEFEEFEAQSKWYMAMTLLKENTEESIDEAVSSFAELIIDETSYKSKAIEALSKMGLSMSASAEPATVDKVGNSSTNSDSPDGSTFGNREWQWGIIIDNSGYRYAFFTDCPIKGLEQGDVVMFYAIKRKNKGKGRRGIGRAIILEKAF